MKISIFGDGAWGTAVALVLAGNSDYSVYLWGRRPEHIEEVRTRRENARYLPGVPIPPSIVLTADASEAAAGSDLWVMAIPAVYLRETLQPLASSLHDDVPFLSLAKGVEHTTFKRPSQIIRDVLGAHRVVVLSGPSHAEEVGRGLPATVVAASADEELARWIQQRFSTDRFRVYTSRDELGVELGGALKNIIGIAAGINDGLGYGDNTKAALLTRGLVEITRFGVALGAEHQTFFGLAGLGDLVTTCVSRHGRNRHVGERRARGESLEQILASMSMVAEGVYTTRSVHAQAQTLGVTMPITTEVYRMLYEGKDPTAAVNDLMRRELRDETLF